MASRAPFSLTTHDRDGELLVTMAGELDMAGAEEVRTFVETTLQRGIPRIRVDAAGVRFIDSIGVRSLLHLTQRCHELGTDVSFTMSPDVQRVLDLMGLGSLAEITPAGPAQS